MILASSTEPIRVPVDGPPGTDLTQLGVSVAIIDDNGTEPELGDYQPAAWATAAEAEISSNPVMWPAGQYMTFVRLSAPPWDVRLRAGRIRIGDTRS